MTDQQATAVVRHESRVPEKAAHRPSRCINPRCRVLVTVMIGAPCPACGYAEMLPAGVDKTLFDFAGMK